MIEQPNDQDNNLKSYIQDLKKAAKSNTKTRVNGSQNRVLNPQAGHPQLQRKLFESNCLLFVSDDTPLNQGIAKFYLSPVAGTNP
jgi:hypothetical protein